MKIKKKTYQCKTKPGQISPYKPDQSDKAALDMIYSMRLAKVVVVNNKFCYCTMGGNTFIKQIENFNTNILANKQLVQSLQEDQFNCKIIEGFRNKIECLNYIKTKLSHLTLVNKLVKDEDERSEYKILVQKCPTTDKVLVVYPRVSRFCKTNNVGAGWMQTHINKGNLIAGYKWSIMESWDYPPSPSTITDLTFQDPFKLGLIIPKKGTTKVGRSLIKSKIIVQTDLEGNFMCEYSSIEEAAKQLNISRDTVKDAARKDSTRAIQYKYKLNYK
jgi:hypothetical protein